MENTFVWDDATANSGYRNWAPGAPDNHYYEEWKGDEDCVYMYGPVKILQNTFLD